MDIKVNADPQIKAKYSLTESIPMEEVRNKINQINSSRQARAFIENNQLVVLQLFID